MKKSFLISLFVLIGPVAFSQPLTNWLEFDGVNDYVSLGNSSTLKPASALTVELWAYHADWGNSNDSRLISNTSGGGYNIQIEIDTLSGLVYLNGEYQRTKVALSLISAGWHHFSLTCDGRYTHLYIDGELQVTDDAGAVYSLVYDSNNCTFLGAEVGGGCDVKGDYFNGAIDEVRIWSVARTQQQIQDNMNIEISSSSTGLVGYWKLNETTGSLAVDEKGSNNSSLVNMSDDDWIPIFEDSNISLPGVLHCSNAWGDYDNDGDLDIILFGKNGSDEISGLYKNNGNGTFSDAGISLPQLQMCAVEWGDYDNDGDLDFSVLGVGPGSSRMTRIYNNEGNGNFTNSGISLTRLYLGDLAWGDYDNDGDLDLLVTGSDPYGDDVSKIYKNNSDGTFTESGIVLQSVDQSSVAWGDYNNDGFLDIILSGYSSTSPYSVIYKNYYGITFSESKIRVPWMEEGEVAWGDYNNDGTLDFNITGKGISSSMNKIFQNNGDGTFSDSQISLIDLELSRSAWGDIDNDGDLDLIVQGYNSYKSYTKIYRNNNDGSFTDFFELLGLISGDIDLGDYDNDGDLDIMISGLTLNSYDYVSKVYKNNCLNSNTVPISPENISSSINGSTAIFSWDAATDNETPSAGLTYNLRIGTTPGGNEVMASMADVSNGFRRIPALGNTNHNTSWTIKNLQQGQRYYWSVQAIDNCFAGSEFSSEGTFLYGISPDEEPGYALEFDGINDYVSGSGLITQNSAYTIEAWIYHNSLPASSQRYVTLSPEVAVIRHDGSAQQGQLHFYIKKSDGSFSSVRANGVLETGKWYHVAGVSDGKEMKLYLNGKEVGSSNPSGSLYANDGNFAISNFSETMDGYIDEVRVWNVVRSESGIRENMHKTLAGNENGLIGYWQLNDGTGATTAAELSGESNGMLHSMDPNNDWVISTVPTGGGSCNNCCGFTNGTGNLGNLILTSTNSFDNEVDLFFTEIERLPNTNSGISGNVLDRYYVLNVFGTPGNFSTNLTFALPEGYISSDDQANPSNLKLYKRESTFDGAWTFVASGTEATSTTVKFEGITSYSQFIIASESSVLPVELISFNAHIEYNKVMLTWQTATEVNNYGFEIERQNSGESSQESDLSDMAEWETLGFVPGYGNSNSPKSYEFVDDLSAMAENSTAVEFEYRLKQIDTDGSYKYYSNTAKISNNLTDVAEEQVPTEFSLSRNYPNPFNPTTTIQYSIPYSVISGERSEGRNLKDFSSSDPSPTRLNDMVSVMLKVYDMLGREVSTLVNDYQSPGNYNVEFDGSQLGSGVFVYKLTAGNYSAVRKMILVK